MESQTFASVFDALCDTPAQAANMRLRAWPDDAHRRYRPRKRLDAKTGRRTLPGLTWPRINDLLNGKIDKFSLDALVNINAGLGQCISLSFAPA
ncbi:helix-turn-helix domain-containing protein [Neisseria gonorrhoeae]